MGVIMKKCTFLTIILFILCLLTLDIQADTLKNLTIAIPDNRPILTDRTINLAFKQIHIDAVIQCFETADVLDFVNHGEYDGAVSYNPDVLENYENLLKVNSPIGQVELTAYASVFSGKKITSWSQLSNQRVGVLVQNPYIVSKLPEDIKSLTYKSSAEKLFLGLVNMEYDYVVFPKIKDSKVGKPEIVVDFGVIETLNEYIYLNKRNEDIVLDLESSIYNLNLDNLIKGDENQKKILHITFNNNDDAVNEVQIVNKLNERFKSDANVETINIDLTSKHYYDASFKYKAYYTILREELAFYEPSVVVVSGNEALTFVKNTYFQLFVDVPVVMSGINGYHPSLIEGYEEYFTGIIDTIAAYSTIEEMLKVFPDTQSIYIINDYSNTGLKYKSEIENELRNSNLDIKVVYSDNLKFSDLTNVVKNLESNTLVLIGYYFYDKNAYISVGNTKKMLEENLKNPLIGVYSQNLEYGEIGGHFTNYELYGTALMDVISKLISGANVSDIKIVQTSEFKKWVFNYEKVTEANIKTSKLPQNSDIINITPDYLTTESLKNVISLIAIYVFVFVIIWLIYKLFLYNKSNKKLIEAQKHLHTAEELLLKDKKIFEIKERLEKILNTAPLAYGLTKHGKMVELNAYMEKAIDIKEGDKIIDFFAEYSDKIRILNRLKKESTVLNEIVRFKLKDGEVHRFHCNCTRVDYENESALALWGIDIEENQRHKDLLEVMQEDMQKVLDSLPIPVKIRDLQTFKLIYCNKAFLNLFGIESQEIAEALGHEKYFPEYQSTGEKSIEIYEKEFKELTGFDYTISSEFEFKKMNGEIFSGESTSCKVYYNGSLASLSIIKDLSKEKQQAQMLINAAEKEKEANQLKGRFLVNMSHEIRTPMNAIIGLTDIELRKEKKSESYEVLKKINSAANSLLEIINDILDLSKIEADKIELYDTQFELEEIINNAMLVVTPRLEGKRVELLLNVDRCLPKYLIGDKVRLWQILKNFLDNSAKYTDVGKIVLSIKCERESDDSIVLGFTVKDTGIGIDKDQLNKVFVPFKQIYNNAQQKYSGTGLGMAISKQLCELMGGRLEIESELGKGTDITVKIPFKKAQSKELLSYVIGKPLLNNKKVLVADDDETSLEIMNEILQNNGMECVLVKSGEEAVETVKKYKEKGKYFDIVLLDYLMKEINGVETARQINNILDKVPKLIMVTAYQRSLMTTDLEENSFIDIIEKPFVPSQFIKKIYAAVSGDRSVLFENDERKDDFIIFKDANVLVCEDNLLNQEVADGILGGFGIKAVMVENGALALEVLETNNFDLIFMDLQMPVMDGYETTKAIRKIEKYKELPIISLTADAMTEVVGKCLEVGMNDYVTKPIDTNMLYQKLLKWLPESKRAHSDMPQMVDEEEAQSVTEFVDGIDMEQGIKRFNGNGERYKKTLLKFGESLENALMNFEDAQNNIEKAKADIHKLKGSAGNLGVTSIYELTVKLDEELHVGNFDNNMYNKLLYTVESIRNEIYKKFKPENDSNIEKETGTTEELIEILESMKTALENYDPVECRSVVEKIKHKSWGTEIIDTLNLICKYATDYEFDKALEIINKAKL